MRSRAALRTLLKTPCPKLRFAGWQRDCMSIQYSKLSTSLKMGRSSGTYSKQSFDGVRSQAELGNEGEYKYVD